jgi:hypothetical protein
MIIQHIQTKKNQRILSWNINPDWMWDPQFPDHPPGTINTPQKSLNIKA